MDGDKTMQSPYNMDGPHFNPDMYLQRLLKDSSLKDIFEAHEAIVRDTQSLHSEMQTLVYENYNKFISATDTIRKMKNDFRQMEAEMDSLGKNMDSITSFSDQISATLQDSRSQISKLSGVHSLLKKLRFLFKLPVTLVSLIDEGNYAEAVDDYLKTQKVLNHYAHLESFKGIQTDCEDIVAQLKEKLHDQFRNEKASTRELAQSVQLLLRLGEPAQSLYKEFLAHAKERLDDQIERLAEEDTSEDIVEFINFANMGPLCDLCVVVKSYNEMFFSPDQKEREIASAKADLDLFIDQRMNLWLIAVESRFEKEQIGPSSMDSQLLVQALDRFYTKLTSVNSLFGSDEYSKRGLQVVLKTGRRECENIRVSLENHFSDWVRGVRSSIAQDQSQSTELLTGLVVNVVEKVKTALNQLKLFVQPELSFARERGFSEKFSSQSVRSGLVLAFLRHIITSTSSFAKPDSSPSLPTLLVLSKMCLEFSTTHVYNLVGLVDSWFTIEVTKENDEEKTDICRMMEIVAQDLVNHYVRLQGNIISQMIRKSIETRDWGHCLEPRTVRPVMKRILEELALSEPVLGSMFEEGEKRAEPGSGSRHQHNRSVASSMWTPTAAHTLHKLFSDKIEIFAPVSFTKISIMTGIIKIGLKTLLECVRLKTFSKFGLQQIQVDIHYLQLYLWRYVSDENLIQLLLDEILNSAVHRCTNPALMEPSVVEIICERG